MRKQLGFSRPSRKQEKLHRGLGVATHHPFFVRGEGKTPTVAQPDCGRTIGLTKISCVIRAAGLTGFRKQESLAIGG
jgi:hypothetical protein